MGGNLSEVIVIECSKRKVEAKEVIDLKWNGISRIELYIDDIPQDSIKDQDVVNFCIEIESHISNYSFFNCV